MSNIAKITLNGKNYAIELPSYRVRDLVDFSPRAATAGGSILHSELGLYQVIMQSDWRGGFGFPWWTTDNGYQRTEGNIDTRQAGIVMMGAGWQTAETLAYPSQVIRGFILFKNYIFAWHDGGLRRSDGTPTVWSDVSPVASTKVMDCWTNGKYLFAAVYGSYIYKSLTGALGTWTTCGINSNSIDYSWIAHHDGYVYAGKRGMNEVYYSDTDDLSDLAGAPADDPDVIYIGAKGMSTNGMISFMGNAYIFTETNMYKLSHELHTGVKTLDFTNEMVYGNYFGAGKYAVHNSMLVIAVNNSVYQWNGVRLADITPQRLDDDFPYDAYSKFSNLTVGRVDLYCTAARVNNHVDLLSFDGVAWHALAHDLSTSGYQPWGGLFFDPYFIYLWMAIYDGANMVTKYMQMRDNSLRLPSSGFPTTGTHSLYTARIDAGFRRVVKSTPSILVEADNLSASKYITVYYSLDGAAFTEWGGAGNGKVTADGVTELSNPTGVAGSTIEYKNLQLRFDFVTNSATSSPILESFTVRLIMRPDTNFGYGFNVIATQNPEVGTRLMDNRTPAEIIADLHTARQSTAPITFIDPFGASHYVYISSVNENSVEYHSDRPGATPIIESRITINLVETG